MPPENTFDFGHGIEGRFIGWHPDPDLNPQYDGASEDRWGLIVSHIHADGEVCEGVVTFDGELQRRYGGKAPRWTVHSLDPLHLEPSILRQECGLHGWIRGGRWVPA